MNSREIYEYNVKIFTDENVLSFYLLGAYMSDGSVKFDQNDQTKSFIQWLYYDENLVCMPRKKTIAQECIKIWDEHKAKPIGKKGNYVNENTKPNTNYKP